jgi:hypothetical protein
MRTRIERALSGCYTVADLIAELQEMDQEAKVVFTTSYGDRTNTMQALVVAQVEEVPTTTLQESSYSTSGLAFSRYDDEQDPDDHEGASVVVLSTRGIDQY